MWIALGVVNTPVYLLVGWAFFHTWSGFFESVKYVLTPDAWSFIKGDYFEDSWESIKFGLWVLACVAAVFGEAALIDHLFLSDAAASN